MIDPKLVTQTAKELYIRALKLLPPDVKGALGVKQATVARAVAADG